MCVCVTVCVCVCDCVFIPVSFCLLFAGHCPANTLMETPCLTTKLKGASFRGCL